MTAHAPDPGAAPALDPATLALAAELGPLAAADDAARAVRRLRAAGHPADRVANAVTQARLRHRAAAKFGDAAGGLCFTDAGLQQATRDVVARHHAARLAARGVRRVADLGCGIGGDALAFAAAGLGVLAVDRDEETAAIAAHNLAGLDATVLVGDALGAPLDDVDAAWLDPARRSGARRLRDPSDWSPSLDAAFALAARLPVGVKLGPGIDRGLLPDGWEWQWVSDRGEVVEVVAWSPQLARDGVGRAALVLDGVRARELTAPADTPDVAPGPLGAWLYEPDGAVIRARLIGDLARRLGATTLDPTIAYLTADAAVDTPFAQRFRVVAELPLDVAVIRRALADRGIGGLEIKKRGADVDPDAFRRRLRLGGPNRATLLLTRIAGRHRAILAERA